MTELNYTQTIEAVKSDTLFIVFSAIGTQKNKFSFFKSFSEVLCHKIFVNTANNDWYQNGNPDFNSPTKLLRHLKLEIARLKPSRVIAFGTSMGGYGALLYGSLLKCTEIIVFSSETILCLDASRSKKYNVQINHKIPDIKQSIQNAKKTKIYLIVGESDIVDLYCAAHIKNLSNVKITSLRRIGHETPRYIHDNISFSKYIELIFNNYQLDFFPNKGSILNHTNAINALFKASSLGYQGKSNDSYLELLDSKDILFEHELYHYYKSIYHKSKNEIELALEAALYSTLLNPDFGPGYQFLGILQGINNQYNTAIQSFEKAKKCIAVKPNSQIDYFIAYNYYKLGVLDTALKITELCIQKNIKISDSLKLKELIVNSN